MGIYLNPDGMNFRSAYNADIFVDKSDIIRLTNHRINNGDDRFIYVSRPRRFGKSYTANMLCAYYSKGSACGELFDKLKIANDPDYLKHRNQYHVIYLDIQKFLDKNQNDIKALLQNITESVMNELKNEFPDFKSMETNLSFFIERLAYECKVQFVFIIDEWDSVFRFISGNDDLKARYIAFFRNLLKGQYYAALVYMTGILPIKHYGNESMLNMFDEDSMARPGEFSPHVGFTAKDVSELCEKYDFDFDIIKYWYDGYLLDNHELYCPNSVVSVIKKKKYKCYWTQTTAYENLADYIARNESGLHDDIETLLTGQRIPVNPNMFSNDLFHFKAKNDILTLLVHLGYLACVPVDTHNMDEKYEAYIPNKEISIKFDDSIRQTGLYEDSIRRNTQSMELLNFTLNGNAEQVAKMIDEAHSDIDPKHYNNEEALRSVIKEAYIMANNFYDIRTEIPAGKGYADVVFVTKPNRDHKYYPPILIELKYDRSVSSALDQINTRDYKKIFQSYKKVLLVGISYHKKEKHHECIITEHNFESINEQK